MLPGQDKEVVTGLITPDNLKKRSIENISIFKQSGNDFGAAKSFGLFKCLPSGIHIKKPVLTALPEDYFRSFRAGQY